VQIPGLATPNRRAEFALAIAELPVVGIVFTCRERRSADSRVFFDLTPCGSASARLSAAWTRPVPGMLFSS